MGLSVKDAAASAKKFVTRAQAAGGDYTAGVQAAGGLWQQKTAASADSWAAGVTQAAQSGRFAKGVTANAAGKYQTNAATKGAQRYPSGVAASGDAYTSGVQPYLNILANLNLQPRQPKGSPANYTRSQQVGQALRDKKLAGTP